MWSKESDELMEAMRATLRSIPDMMDPHSCGECGAITTQDKDDMVIPLVTPRQLAAFLMMLDMGGRKRFMEDLPFCQDCWGTELPCHCWNDE